MIKGKKAMKKSKLIEPKNEGTNEGHKSRR